MSTLPFMMSLADELDSLTNNQSYLDDFGLGFYPHRHYHRSPSIQLSLPANTDWLRPSRGRRSGDTRTTVSSVAKDGFEVCMDVQQFKPNELSVKTVDDFVVVEGKHDEQAEEQGVVFRKFVRRKSTPKAYESDEVVSTLSSAGVRTEQEFPESMNSFKLNEQFVKIQYTGPLAEHPTSGDDPVQEEIDEKKNV